MTRAGQLMVAAFILAWAMIGCETVGGLTDAESAQVQAGDRAVVLLRIQCSIDGKPCEPFTEEEFGDTPIFAFGLGGFETILEPWPVTPRFLSEDSKRRGWFYFVLEPGIYHLAVIGPDTSASYMRPQIDYSPLARALRWHMDVPEGAAVVYAGTLCFEAMTDSELPFGRRTIRRDPVGTISLRDDSEEANLIAAGRFPTKSGVSFVPLERWRPGESKKLRTPHHLKSKAAP